MKTLIIYGSPRVNGDSASLAGELKKRLEGEINEISAYRDKVSPCIDCRYCHKSIGCVIQDDMEKIYRDDFNNVVIASPVYSSGLPGPLMSLASRFQAYYAADKFLQKKININPKRAGLILTGGGYGTPDAAIRLSYVMFKYMNASGADFRRVFSLHTDVRPAAYDEKALRSVELMAESFNFLN